jgi:hypothetical protein
MRCGLLPQGRRCDTCSAMTISKFHSHALFANVKVGIANVAIRPTECQPDHLQGVKSRGIHARHALRGGGS